jgi:hypothetical protein
VQFVQTLLDERKALQGLEQSLLAQQCNQRLKRCLVDLFQCLLGLADRCLRLGDFLVTVLERRQSAILVVLAQDPTRIELNPAESFGWIVLQHISNQPSQFLRHTLLEWPYLRSILHVFLIVNASPFDDPRP